ncbi:MAG: YeeE/YedE family protein [Gemmatimonadota bacterium]
MQWVPLSISAGVLLWGTVLLAQYGWRHASLLAVGAALGLVLYVTSFGFTYGYRRAILVRDYSAVYAQLVMLGLATILFAVPLAQGSVFGQPAGGATAPVSLQVVVGAFMFGLGMQLGGGCGSGTLFSVGGGNTRMLITLGAFCGGAFWASLHMTEWARLPATGPISLGHTLGWPAAVGLQLGALGLIGLAVRWARRRSGHDSGRSPSSGSPGSVPDSGPPLVGATRLLRNPAFRLLLLGAVGLALLNFATLLLAGHPWTVTWGFTLWGAKLAQLVGWDPSSNAFWTAGFQSAAVAGPVLGDRISVMDAGIVLGALATSAVRGRFRPGLRISARSLLAAVVGGLMLGYGSRIAYGCTIGAFFSGVASTSVHGWLWIASALPGTWLGVRLRPWFDLAN